MTIAVLGSDGRSGKIFVQKALDSGYRVKAGVYSSDPALLQSNDNLEIIRCDATSRAQVQALINGADVIVSLIGHSKNSPANMQTEATKTIIESMSSCSIKRFISLTGSGARMPGDKITFMDRLFSVGIKIIDSKRVSDGVNHLKILQQSNLDWTVLRVVKLSNRKPKNFKLTENGPGKTFVSRHEVAQAILKLIEDESYIKKAPIISTAQRDESY